MLGAQTYDRPGQGHRGARDYRRSCVPLRGPLRVSERVGGGGNPVELGAAVSAEAAEVQLGVVLDPAHCDLDCLAIAFVRLGALASREDVGELLAEESLYQYLVVRGAGAGVARAMDDALGDLRDRHAARREILHQHWMHPARAREAVGSRG